MLLDGIALRFKLDQMVAERSPPASRLVLGAAARPLPGRKNPRFTPRARARAPVAAGAEALCRDAAEYQVTDIIERLRRAQVRHRKALDRDLKRSAVRTKSPIPDRSATMLVVATAIAGTRTTGVLEG
jgi:hypothetical protein